MRSKLFHPEIFLLFIYITFFVVVVSFFGHMLAPILASLVIAYLLDSLILLMERKGKIPRKYSLYVVYLFFLALMVFSIVLLLPLLWQQFSQAIDEIPQIADKLHVYANQLSTQYPNVFEDGEVQKFFSSSNFGMDKIASWGKVAFSISISSLPNLITWMVYLFLVPLLVFFFLKDKLRLTKWFASYMPKERRLIVKVGYETQSQLGNYVRGKVIELFVVGFITYISFLIFDLNYAALLAFLVGLSVVIPYVGIIVVTIPVMIVGVLQWGFDAQFAYMMTTYAIIQLLDGNLLVPLLFSEAVDLHPIAVIAAVLVFGGIWGFWGLFFAIPLATLVKAIMRAWHGYSIAEKNLG
ncbi:MAG: AI-2E family transporter [Thiotrichales bacterium]|nr:MAG: AI-2E family transporter [Thiotrichales bacterium]